MRRIFESPLGIIIVILVLLLVEYYCIVALRTALRGTTRNIRQIITWAYIILNVGFYVMLLNGRTLLDPSQTSTLSKYFVAIMIGFLLAKLIVAVVLLFGDIYRFIVWIFSNKKTVSDVSNEVVRNANAIPRSQFLSQMAILGGSLMFGTFLYGTKNKYNYQVRNVNLKFPNLPDKFDGLKVVHITDIHSGSFDSPEDVLKGVQKIMELNADLILFTGDIVNNLNTELIPFKDIFKQLSAPLGVFAVLGNHDYGDYHQWENQEAKVANLDALKQHFKDMNWELLMNEHIIFDKYGDRIALVGVENWSSHMNFPKYGKMDEAMAGINEHQPMFKILMSHDPSHWDAEILSQYQDIDLTLSGHTHGMQFGIRLPWMQWSPVKYVYKQWMGLYQQGKQYLYVNPGFGFIGYRGRVGILPEITLFQLNKG